MKFPQVYICYVSFIIDFFLSHHYGTMHLGDDVTAYPGNKYAPKSETYLDKTYKVSEHNVTLAIIINLLYSFVGLIIQKISDTTPNGNYAGTCTSISGPAYFCSGLYNIDQFYDKTSKALLSTGACSGSISLVDLFTPETKLKPVTGGTGAYKGASGEATITSINDSSKCPKSAASCYKIDFNLD